MNNFLFWSCLLFSVSVQSCEDTIGIKVLRSIPIDSSMIYVGHSAINHSDYNLYFSDGDFLINQEMYQWYKKGEVTQIKDSQSLDKFYSLDSINYSIVDNYLLRMSKDISTARVDTLSTTGQYFFDRLCSPIKVYKKYPLTRVDDLQQGKTYSIPSNIINIESIHRSKDRLLVAGTEMDKVLGDSYAVFYTLSDNGIELVSRIGKIENDNRGVAILGNKKDQVQFFKSNNDLVVTNSASRVVISFPNKIKELIHLIGDIYLIVTDKELSYLRINL